MRFIWLECSLIALPPEKKSQHFLLSAGSVGGNNNAQRILCFKIFSGSKIDTLLFVEICGDNGNPRNAASEGQRWL
jgi:hypothetical protein